MVASPTGPLAETTRPVSVPVLCATSARGAMASAAAMHSARRTSENDSVMRRLSEGGETRGTGPCGEELVRDGGPEGLRYSHGQSTARGTNARRGRRVPPAPSSIIESWRAIAYCVRTMTSRSADAPASVLLTAIVPVAPTGTANEKKEDPPGTMLPDSGTPVDNARTGSGYE